MSDDNEIDTTESNQENTEEIEVKNLEKNEDKIIELEEENIIEDFNSITEKQYQLFNNSSSDEKEISIKEDIIIEDKKEEIENTEEQREKILEEKNIEKVEDTKEKLKENEKEEIIEINNSLDEEKEETQIELQEVEKEEIEEKTLTNDEIISETEIKDDKELLEEVYEPKTVVLDFNEDIEKLETALEIKYSSLKLLQFPIKISNILEGMTFPDEVVIGNTSIKIGNETINNCNLKILSNESIRMLEIKNREFKLGLSVSLNNDTIKAYGSIRSYEVSSLIKHSRMIKVLEMFEKIFNGAPISFKVNKLYGDIVSEDRMELMKIKTIQHFFETIDKSGYKFQIDKLPKCENVYYLLELNSAFRENRVIETWCNFNIKNEDLKLHEKDLLIIKRKHRIDKNLVIEEKITFRNPIEKDTIFKGKIVGYRKPCLIELSKVQD